MTKLISGRVKKIPSANVGASRYDFLKLSEAEPDLGLPAANGYVLSGNVDGTRRWILLSTEATLANVANTVLSINNFTTANLAEDVNLYYTNARVYANVIGLLNGKANVVDLTTANVAELTNLYYTNARVDAYISPTLTTANVVESTSNLYYTVTRANAAIDDRVTKSFIDNLGVSSSSAVFAENANVANTVLSISNFTTSNLIEGANLYYTNARVYSNVISLLNAKADVTDLTTSNVVEGNNLYYTNTRVHANVVALLPSVNVSIVSSYQQFVSDGATTVYTLSTSVPNESSIFVIIDGLTQIPSLDYTASGTTLSLLTVPANQSNVVVRYFSATLSQ